MFLPLKQFPLQIWQIQSVCEGEDHGIESRLPFKIFSTLTDLVSLLQARQYIANPGFSCFAYPEEPEVP